MFFLIFSSFLKITCYLQNYIKQRIGKKASRISYKSIFLLKNLETENLINASEKQTN